MSEWLTTGQMIDQLQVGEIAESEDGVIRAFYKKVDIYHELYFESDETAKSARYVFTEDDKKEKWRIVPNYVTFEEAMKAVADGKNVKVYPIQDGKEMRFISFAHTERLSNRLEYYTLEQLTKFNWTIDN